MRKMIFLLRPDNCGSLHLSDSDAENKFRVRYTLNNGELVVFIRPLKSAVKVGDKFTFQVGMHSDSMPETLFSEKTLVVTIAKKHARPPPPPPRPKPDEQIPRAGFPPYKLLTEHGREVAGEETTPWAEFREFECTEKDGGYVHNLGDEGKMYYINCDNASLTSYVKSLKLEDQTVATKKYIISMRILLLGLEQASSSLSSESSEYVDDFRRMAAKGAASVAMTVCDHLPKVFELDKGSEADE